MGPATTVYLVVDMLGTLGKYRLVRKLASGGMAEIFLAAVEGPEGFSKNVAIKRLHSHLTQDNEFVNLFLDEARLAARFNHPNLVQIFELGEERGQYFIAMEYVHGQSTERMLREFGRRGDRLPWEIGVKILSQACDGLAYAHDFADPGGRPLNLVHRDVNPQNILLSYDGMVKLIDFGIAKATASLHLSGKNTFKGRAAYMAPEQISASSQVDRRADLFSLGVVLYEFSTGERPFQGEGPMEIMNSIQQHAFPDPRRYHPDLPEDLVQAIFRCLEKNPVHRFASAGELRDVLEGLLLDRRIVVDWNTLGSTLRELIPPEGPEEEAAGPKAPEEKSSAPDDEERTITDRQVTDSFDDRVRENALRSRPTLYIDQVVVQPQPTLHLFPAARAEQNPTILLPVAESPFQAPAGAQEDRRAGSRLGKKRRWWVLVLVILAALAVFTLAGFWLKDWFASRGPG